MAEDFLELIERLGEALNAEIRVCDENMQVVSNEPDHDLRRFAKRILKDIYYDKTLPVQPDQVSRVAAGQLLGYL